jgi:hypothetical protein
MMKMKFGLGAVVEELVGGCVAVAAAAAAVAVRKRRRRRGVMLGRSRYGYSLGKGGEEMLLLGTG